MFYVLLVIAVLLIVLEIFSAKNNRRILNESKVSEKWNKVYRWHWLIGVPFVIISTFVYYPMAGETESYRVMGFPLMVAAFDEAGRDSVSPFTFPFFLTNAVIWYFFPQIILAALERIVRFNNAKA